MGNNFYKPKNEYGKPLIAAGTPKSETDAKPTDFIDISWVDTQDDLTAPASKKLVSSDAIEALKTLLHDQLQFNFKIVASEDELPAEFTSENIDVLRTTVYLIKLTHEKDAKNIYAEYFCTNTEEYVADGEQTATPKFEKLGVAVATKDEYGTVKLSDTPSKSLDADEGTAATPKALYKVQKDLQDNLDEVEETLADVAVLKTDTLTVTETGSVTTKIPTGSVIVRFESGEVGTPVTTLFPGITYGEDEEGETSVTLTFWGSGSTPDDFADSLSVKMSYMASYKSQHPSA